MGAAGEVGEGVGEFGWGDDLDVGVSLGDGCGQTCPGPGAHREAAPVGSECLDHALCQVPGDLDRRPVQDHLALARPPVASRRVALLGLGVAADRVNLDVGLTGMTRPRPGLREALAATRAARNPTTVGVTATSGQVCSQPTRCSPSRVS